MKKSITHHVEIPISGRFLVDRPPGAGPFPVLVGFHGYGQTAEDQLGILRQFPGAGNWILCSVQGLHPFYPRPDRIGASWMTSQDRRLRIEENIRYINRVVVKVGTEHPVNQILVFHGFSQGTAMACRAAILGEHSPVGVILHGGEIPPELDHLDRLGHVLIARGERDPIYRPEQLDRDLERLDNAGVSVTRCEFDGGHDAGDIYFQAVGSFLENL